MVGSDTVSSKPRALKGRDLITIGIFTALYFVVNFACMLVSGLHPYLWVFMPALDALLAGIPFMLACAKVPKFGTVLVMGMVPSLVYFVTGMFTPLILGTMLASWGGGGGAPPPTAASSATPLPMRSSASGCAEAPCRYGRFTTRSWRRSRLRGWAPTIWQRSKPQQRPK